VDNVYFVGDGDCAHSMWSTARSKVDGSSVYLLAASAGVGWFGTSDVCKKSRCGGNYFDCSTLVRVCQFLY